MGLQVKMIYYNSIEEAYIGSIRVLRKFNNSILCYSIDLQSDAYEFHHTFADFFERHVSAIGVSYYNDCMRSMLSLDSYNKDFQFSYFERMTTPLNQIKFVNEVFSHFNDSKKMIITMVEPEIDAGKKITPCFICLVFNYKEKSATAVFRAHDYGKRAYYNLIAVKALIDKHFSNLNIKKLNVISIIAYIEDDLYVKLKEVMPDVFVD